MALVKLDNGIVLNTDAVELLTDYGDHVGIQLRSGAVLRVEGAVAQAVKDSFADLTTKELVEEPPAVASFWSKLKGVFGG